MSISYNKLWKMLIDKNMKKHFPFMYQKRMINKVGCAQKIAFDPRFPLMITSKYSNI